MNLWVSDMHGLIVCLTQMQSHRTDAKRDAQSLSVAISQYLINMLP